VRRPLPPSARPHVRARLGVIALSCLGLAGCATTYDDSLATAQASTSTSSTLPSGTAEELLPRLLDEATGLSGLMIAGDDADSSAQRIAELWDAVKAEVDERRPDLLSDFSSNVALTGRAVQFSRAADADKAAKNLQRLVDAYLAS
jgi:hypothetical protein